MLKLKILLIVYLKLKFHLPSCFIWLHYLWLPTLPLCFAHAVPKAWESSSHLRAEEPARLLSVL